jgi:hypothetical protein
MKKSVKIIAILTVLVLALTFVACDIKGTLDMYSEMIHDLIMSNEGFLKEDEKYHEDTPMTEFQEEYGDFGLIKDEKA